MEGRTKKSVTITLDRDLLAEINEVRGFEPLSSYINRVLGSTHGRVKE